MFGSQERRTGYGIGPAPASRAAEGDGASALVQYLSVFILLLGFFILMTALSRFEEAKVGSVLSSVEDAFARAEDAEGAATDRFRQGALAEASTAVRALGDQLMTDIPVAKLDVTSDGRTLVLSMPAAEMLRSTGDDLALRGDRIGLLNRVADVLLPRAGGVQVRMEALLSTAAGPAATKELVAGAGAIARGLVRHGAPAGALTVGFEPGTPGRLRLLFSLTAGGRAVAFTGEAAP